MADNNSNRRHHRFVDLTGKRFGKWTVLSEATNHPGRMVYWTCRCECGTEASVRGVELTGDRSHGCKPCGKRQHGMCDTPEHIAWQCMNDRCNNPNSKSFPAYGGNGITICERWKSFENFYADMGPKPSPSHSNDRIDGSKGYSPENCRWATPEEQARNMQTNRLVTYMGKTLCVAAWADKIGVNISTLRKRLSYGWSVERALTEPVKTGR